MLTNVNFISMAVKKSVFVSTYLKATISKFSKKYTLWKHNFDTLQTQTL